MLKILWVGKTKENNLKNLINEYKKRILAVVPIRNIEIEEEKRSGRDNEYFLKKEMVRIMENLSEDDYLIVLSERGKMMSSEKFSDFLMDKFNKNKNISFVLVDHGGFQKNWRRELIIYFHSLP